MKSIDRERVLRLNCPGFGEESHLNLGRAKSLDNYQVIVANPVSLLHLFDKGPEPTRRINQLLSEGVNQLNVPDDALIQELINESDSRLEELIPFLSQGGLLVYFLCRPFVLAGPTISVDNYDWLSVYAPALKSPPDNGSRQMSALSHGRVIEPTDEGKASEMAEYLDQSSIEWNTIIRTDFLSSNYSVLATAAQKKCISAQFWAGDNGGKVIFLPAPYSPDFDRVLMNCINKWYQEAISKGFIKDDSAPLSVGEAEVETKPTGPSFFSDKAPNQTMDEARLEEIMASLASHHASSTAAAEAKANAGANPAPQQVEAASVTAQSSVPMPVKQPPKGALKGLFSSDALDPFDDDSEFIPSAPASSVAPAAPTIPMTAPDAAPQATPAEASPSKLTAEDILNSVSAEAGRNPDAFQVLEPIALAEPTAPAELPNPEVAVVNNFELKKATAEMDLSQFAETARQLVQQANVIETATRDPNSAPPAPKQKISDILKGLEFGVSDDELEPQAPEITDVASSPLPSHVEESPFQSEASRLMESLHAGGSLNENLGQPATQQVRNAEPTRAEIERAEIEAASKDLESVLRPDMEAPKNFLETGRYQLKEEPSTTISKDEVSITHESIDSTRSDELSALPAVSQLQPVHEYAPEPFLEHEPESILQSSHPMPDPVLESVPEPLFHQAPQTLAEAEVPVVSEKELARLAAEREAKEIEEFRKSFEFLKEEDPAIRTYAPEAAQPSMDLEDANAQFSSSLFGTASQQDAIATPLAQSDELEAPAPVLPDPEIFQGTTALAAPVEEPQERSSLRSLLHTLGAPRLEPTPPPLRAEDAATETHESLSSVSASYGAAPAPSPASQEAPAFEAAQPQSLPLDAIKEEQVVNSSFTQVAEESAEDRVPDRTEPQFADIAIAQNEAAQNETRPGAAYEPPVPAQISAPLPTSMPAYMPPASMPAAAEMPQQYAQFQAQAAPSSAYPQEAPTAPAQALPTQPASAVAPAAAPFINIPAEMSHEALMAQAPTPAQQSSVPLPEPTQVPAHFNAQAHSTGTNGDGNINHDLNLPAIQKNDQSAPQPKDLIKKMEEMTKTAPPTWCDEFSFPFIDLLKNEHTQMAEQIRQMQGRLSSVESRIRAVDTLKVILLTGENDALMSGSQEVLSRLGWQVQQSRSNVNELWLSRGDQVEAIARIVHSAAGANRTEVAQLAESVIAFWDEYETEPKGILIAQTWSSKHPAERTEPDFSPALQEFAGKKHLSLMSTMQLLSMYKDVELNTMPVDEIRKRMIDTSGRLLGFPLDNSNVAPAASAAR